MQGCQNGDILVLNNNREESENMDSFFDKIKKQLKRMTEAEKDAWILSQAKI